MPCDTCQKTFHPMQHSFLMMKDTIIPRVRVQHALLNKILHFLYWKTEQYSQLKPDERIHSRPPCRCNCPLGSWTWHFCCRLSTQQAQQAENRHEASELGAKAASAPRNSPKLSTSTTYCKSIQPVESLRNFQMSFCLSCAPFYRDVALGEENEDAECGIQLLKTSTVYYPKNWGITHMQIYRKVNRMPMACAKAGARCRKLLCLSTSGTWHNIAGAHESLRMCYHMSVSYHTFA